MAVSLDRPPPRPPEAVDLSVVLPCYRSADVARRSAAVLGRYLDGLDLSWEIVVVDDGGGDFDPAGWPDEGPVRLIVLPRNAGKGAAVRAGMLAARGRARVFTDVDLPYDLSLIPVCASYLLERGFAIVVGDRTLDGSSYALEVGWRRRLASAVFSLWVGKVVTGGFFDTQCGLKGFRGDVADALFRLTRVDRFAFDVEVLYLALKHRLDIKRIPVRLRQNDTSSVRLLRDSARMFVDTLRIKLFQMRGCYRSPELHRLAVADFARLEADVAARSPAAALAPPRDGA